MVKVGFTGTRNGLSYNQKNALYEFFSTNKVEELHHGDCVGADSDVHQIIRKLYPKIKIVVHPPLNPALRAFTDGDEQKIACDYLTRNKNIVKNVDILIACPNSPNEVLRSGTWSTIRYAQDLKKPYQIII